MRRLALLAVVGCTLLAPAADATTIAKPEGSVFPYQRWAVESKMPTPEVELTVVEEACPGLEADFAWACTEAGAYTIWIDGPARNRKTFLHEIGHNFDYYVLPEWARVRFGRLVGVTAEWTTPPNSLAERFADAYSRCAERGLSILGDPDLAIRGNGMGALDNRQYRRICRLITASAR